MRYTVNAETFMQLPYTTGTVQNVSNTDIEISNEQTTGTGIVLKAGESFAFNNATVYACARPVLDGGTGIISVVPFNGEGEGGESPIYVPKGSVAFASLPSTLNSTMLGWTYNVSDAFTTDSRFVEGSGIDYPAGENVVVVEVTTGVFKYDCFGGAYILPVANTTTLGGVKSSATDGKVSVDNDGTMTYNPLGYRHPNTAYTAGQIAYHSALPTGWYLECITKGTTAAGEITPSGGNGSTVVDGTVSWTIRGINSIYRDLTKNTQLADLNDYQNQGLYSINDTNIANHPQAGAWGKLLVFDVKRSYDTTPLPIQLFGDYRVGGHLFYRQYVNNEWTGWQQQEAIVAKFIAANGYVKYASGVIVQWGNLTVSSSTEQLDFPISFTYGYSITATPMYYTTAEVSASDKTLSNVKLLNNIGAMTIAWYAIGC